MSLIVVAFNGSPRPKGNTYHALEAVLGALAQEGISGEIVQLGGRRLAGCAACFKCFKSKDKRCQQGGDEMNEFIARAVAADGIIIGSPVYFSNVTAEVKAFIDRCGMVARANDDMLKGKVGAAVVVARRAGATFAYSAINFFFGISQMVIPSSNYWNLGLALAPGDILKDEEALNTFKTLGQNMARVLKKLAQ
ncbi:flavodoxin family protein [Desulfovirgula thermocuniculi]|uniref:flavodoxin family protein n=1 Tax=Desulfovirgula thermocuniculi TaxID=348842 RepID=UPI000413B8A8|nr:flavodoxin family protein [Desulfovirgula thermocuniculi]